MSDHKEPIPLIQPKSNPPLAEEWADDIDRAVDLAAQDADAAMDRDATQAADEPLLILTEEHLAAGGVVQASLSGVGIHIKYEVEFNSSLVAKAQDPWGPHIEIDLDLPPVMYSVAGVPVLDPSRELIALESRRARILLNKAAHTANAVAYRHTAALLTQMRANRAVAE